MLNFGISSGCISHRTANILHRNSGHFAQNRGHFAQKQRTLACLPRYGGCERARRQMASSLRSTQLTCPRTFRAESAYISGRVRVHFRQSPRTFRAFPLTLVGGTADYFVSHQPGFLAEMLRFVRFFRFSRPLWISRPGVGRPPYARSAAGLG